jgi:hypothetical protein
MATFIIILFIIGIGYALYWSTKDEPSTSYQQVLTLNPIDKDCPYCKETIKSDAIKCRHCGSMLIKQDKSSPLMTGCLWIVGIFFGLIILGSLVGTNDDTSVSSNRDLNCNVHFTGTQIIITNNDDFTYRNIKVKLNDKWSDNITSIGPGEHYAIGILNFSDEDGNRFGWMQKPKSCSISCDGGFYYATW